MFHVLQVHFLQGTEKSTSVNEYELPDSVRIVPGIWALLHAFRASSLSIWMINPISTSRQVNDSEIMKEIAR